MPSVKVIFPGPLLSICLVLALCLTCVPSALAVGDGHFSGGTGTPSDPYQISTAQDLFDLAKAVNEDKNNYDYYSFLLTNDIDLKTNASNPWTPIGNSASAQGQQFLGSFDGGGYTVSGLYVEGTHGYAGLFGVVGMSNQTTRAEVKNLRVEGKVFVERDSSLFYAGRVAGFVGQGAKITDCSFQGTVETTVDNRAIAGYTGGIAGYNFGTISECKVSNSIISGTNQSTTADIDIYAAGIAPYNVGGTIETCTVESSTITGTNNSDNQASQSLAGGIAAFNTFLGNIKGTIEECEVTGGSVSTVGTVKVSSVGGIAATNEGTVTKCSNSASVTGNNTLPIA